MRSLVNMGSASFGGNKFLLVFKIFRKHCGSLLCMLCNALVCKYHSPICSLANWCITCCPPFVPYLQGLAVMNITFCYDVAFCSEGLEGFLTSTDCLTRCQLSDGSFCGTPSELERLLLGQFWWSWKPFSPYSQFLSWVVGYGLFWVNDGLLGSIMQMLTENNFSYNYYFFVFTYVCCIFTVGHNGIGPFFGLFSGMES